MNIGAHYQGGDRCQFVLWAPEAETVTLQVVAPKPQQFPMQRLEGGYWEITAEGVTPGSLYLYQLDDREARPDPASYFQPQGVHGPSQVIDPAFDWQDQNWSSIPLEDLVLYELHVGTFTDAGSFEAVIDRLPDLKQLGVNAIELMPIAQFPGDKPTEDPNAYRNWGYDGVYPFATQNSYGGPESLKRLVDACHQQGIAVVLDVVYNHFGPEGNYMSQFGPYFTETYKTPWGSAMNFDDRHSHHVRDFFIQNALYWLREFHLDGLRLDAIHAIYDLGAKHFLAELNEAVNALSRQRGRKLYLIAESDLNDPRIVRPIEAGGYGLDAQWSDDFHHALHTLITGEQTGYYQDFGKVAHLAKAYTDTFVYDWCYSPHRQRFHGNKVLDRPPSQFVICIQNHDQVGNRMMGDRLSRLTSFEGLKLAAGAMLLSPYIPLLFMGEEYGEEAPFAYFVSHSDPDLIRAVREGRKREFAAFHAQGEPPDPEAPETFNQCKLNWEKRKAGKHQALWSLYQHLIQLRNTTPALKRRDHRCQEAGYSEAQKVLWWHRQTDENQMFCLMNFSLDAVTLSPKIPAGSWQKILDSADGKWQGPGSKMPEKLTGSGEITLQPQSFALYEGI